MRVVCILEELLREHVDIDNATLAERIGVDERTAAKLRTNGTNWRLTRDNLKKLTVFAYEYGYEHGIFEVRHHPLWSSFQKSNVILFRGDQLSDANAEASIREFLASIHTTTKTTVVADIASKMEKSVAEAMRNSNCIFIGSPRHNPSTEIALSLLWGAKSFDTKPSNRERLPFQMARLDGDYESSIVSRGRHAGFNVHTNMSPANPAFVPVSWLPPEQYRTWHGEGNDAAMVVVCRSPLHSAKPVTSLIVCGYTGLATRHASHELIAADPPLSESDLNQLGVPHLFGYAFSFRKPKAHRRPEFGEQRKVIENTGRWAPPWEQIAET